MSAPKPGQYGEPWRPYRGNRYKYIKDVAGNYTAGMVYYGRTTHPARIIACVNALDGRDPEALKGLIEAAQNAEKVLSRYITLDDSAGIAATNILHSALAAFGVTK